MSDRDIHDIMREDLQRALKKPRHKRRWSMTIDLRKCIGCDACATGCIDENVTPPNMHYRPVIVEESGEFPNVAARFIPIPCQHCDNPPCTWVCPVSATYKRDDGVVVVDYKKCIGCRYCLVACPYGARYADLGDFHTPKGFRKKTFEVEPFREYDRTWTRRSHFDSPIGNARKCHFCIHRIEKGELPRCVVTCVGDATFFGDVSDPDSLIVEVTSVPNTMKYKEALGTKPSLTYIV